MNIDHFFTIGQQHVKQGAPCEDYALSRQPASNLVYAAVADGCGGAFADTDVGARALSFAFDKVVRARQDQAAGWFDAAFFDELKAAFTGNRITDSVDDYYATLVGLVATPENAGLYVFGDGAYLIRYKDRRYKLVWFEWQGNAPFYLNYHLHPDRYAQYRDDLQDCEGAPVHENRVLFQETESGELDVLDEGNTAHPFEAFEKGYVATFQPAADNIEAIAIFTDGIDKVGDIVNYTAAHEFVSFKNFRGGFVKRRMIHALAHYAKEGRLPQDDLSMACVWFGDD